MSDNHIKKLIFLEESEKNAFDKELRRKIRFNISKYDHAVVAGKQQYADLELAKKKAAVIKSKVLNNLDGYLIEFEKNFEERGGKIIWAIDTNHAVKEVLAILKNNKSKLVVKSKSMVTEEIELNPQLEKKEIEVIETDLGEFIVQQRNEPPYHIVTPAMHLSKNDVSQLFTENEGNAMMSMTLPKIHIVITGIEKIIPSLTHLDLFWPLLATHGTGQWISVYNSIISGPKQGYETDGPEKMYVIILDNKRSELLKQVQQRKALTCIKCGACLNACPVYKNIGGHSYATTYSGPIGAVITPYLKGMYDYKHLSFASSLCGKCTEVCPVKINLHELLLFNRSDAINQKYFTRSEKLSMWIFKKATTENGRMDSISSGLKNMILRKFFAKAWGRRRALPIVKSQSFKQLWEERKGKQG